MDYNASFHISATGMAVEKMRLDVAAANLANVHTSAPAGTQPFRPMQVVARENPLTFAQQFGALEEAGGGGVEVVAVQAQNVAPSVVYEPGHPDADSAGYVTYPNVNPVMEMTDLLSAVRAYQLNAAAVQAAKNMIQQSLQILS